MTTLLIVQLPDGRRRRCAAACHHALPGATRCICGGVYRGLQDPSEDLRRVVDAHAGAVLAAAARRETAGDWRILAWREALDGPLLWRDGPLGLAAQLPLFAEIAAPAGGGHGA